MSHLTQSGYIYTQNKGIYVTIFYISRVGEELTYQKICPFLLEFRKYLLPLHRAFPSRETAYTFLFAHSLLELDPRKVKEQNQSSRSLRYMAQVLP